MTLIDQLVAARCRAGLSQVALASKLDLTPGAIGHYETSRRRVPISVAERWADACGHVLEVRVRPLAEERAAVEHVIDRFLALSDEDRVLCLRMIEDLPGGDSVARQGIAALVGLLKGGRRQ